MPTSNTYIRPDDGWVQVVQAPNFLCLSQFPRTHPYYVYSGPSHPTVADPSGMYTLYGPFVVNVPISDTIYVRATSMTPSGDMLGRLRIDAIWVDGGGVPSGITSDSTMITSDSTIITADQT